MDSMPVSSDCYPHEVGPEVRAYIAALVDNDPQREYAVIMHAFGGASLRGMAAETGLHKTTIQRDVARFREQFAVYMGRRLDEDPEAAVSMMEAA